MTSTDNYYRVKWMKASATAISAALWCAACAFAADLPHDIEAAEAASTESQSKHSAYYDKVLQPFFYENVMSRCIQHSFEDKTPFVMVLALDAAGKVVKVYEQPATRVSRCLDEQIAKTDFPKPPSFPFFAHFDMRFEKTR